MPFVGSHFVHLNCIKLKTFVYCIMHPQNSYLLHMNRISVTVMFPAPQSPTHDEYMNWEVAQNESLNIWTNEEFITGV
jgi:hypothetical protein